jgi:DNA helicase-2/ATP-dependent DNA helicase PcrA
MELKTLNQTAKVAGMKLPAASLTKVPVKMQAGNTGPIQIKASPVQLIVAGAKVLHERFGEGKVISLEGAPDNKIAIIFFGPEIGEKRIMLKFAKLQVL